MRKLIFLLFLLFVNLYANLCCDSEYNCVGGNYNVQCLKALSGGSLTFGKFCFERYYIDFYEVNLPSSSDKCKNCKTFDSDINACITSDNQVNCIQPGYVFNPKTETCVNANDFNKKCFKSCSGYVLKSDPSSGTCKCQSCETIVKNLLKQCGSKGLKDGLTCSSTGSSVFVNFNSSSDVCKSSSNSSLNSNNSGNTIGFNESFDSNNSFNKFNSKSSCLAAGGSWLCVGSSCSCIKSSDKNTSGSGSAGSGQGSNSGSGSAGSGQGSNSGSGFAGSYQGSNSGSGSLDSSLLSDISSKISDSNSKLSDIDTNIKNIISLKPDKSPNGDLDSNTKTFLSGFSDTLKNIKDSVSSLKNSSSQVIDLLKNPSKVTLFSNSDIQTCPVNVTLYGMSQTFDICKMVSPYRPLIQLFFTLFFSISVLLYFFDVFIRSK